MKQVLRVIFVALMALSFGGCKDKEKKLSIKEKQSKACRGMIQTKAKIFVKGEKFRAGTKVLDYKIISYREMDKFDVMLSEAYIDFNGTNHLHGRWACVFKKGATGGFSRLEFFKGKDGKWESTDKLEK